MCLFRRKLVTRTKVEAYLSLHSRQAYTIFKHNVMVKVHLILLFTTEHNTLLPLTVRNIMH